MPDEDNYFGGSLFRKMITSPTTHLKNVGNFFVDLGETHIILMRYTIADSFLIKWPLQKE